MKITNIGTLVVVAVAAVSAVSAKDCAATCSEVYEPVCGSNGKTYQNQCTFDKEICTRNVTLSKVGDTACEGDEGSEVVSEGKATELGDGSLVDGISHAEDDTSSDDQSCEGIMCATVDDPVCGSDGKTYSNECVFSGAQCKNKELRLASKMSCASAVVIKVAIGVGCLIVVIVIYCAIRRRRKQRTSGKEAYTDDRHGMAKP